mmetsp:Transcript_10781/g.30716  ORF Transcript_10781/g.30716 Transcript_10781/m.30716 type:complete len:208 (+) Transcript_10781:239-862(+)
MLLDLTPLVAREAVTSVTVTPHISLIMSCCLLIRRIRQDRALRSSTRISCIIKLMEMMSLRQASPLSLAMPLQISSKLTEPLPSASNMVNKFIWSSSAKSKSSKILCTRSSCRTNSKVSGEMSVHAARWMKFDGSSSLSPASSLFESWISQTSANNFATLRAKKPWSISRSLLANLALFFAAMTTFSTNIAAMTLNNPNDMTTAVTL